MTEKPKLRIVKNSKNNPSSGGGRKREIAKIVATILASIPVADPGFPIGGGVDLVGGAVNS